MNQNPGIEAVRTLANMGYRFEVNGENIKARYEGPGKPDPSQVRPLVGVMKAHKPDVVDFLKNYCPKCGGVFFGTFNGVPRCMACYWGELVEFNPGLRVRH
jgi:ribosomal protein S27AE